MIVYYPGNRPELQKPLVRAVDAAGFEMRIIGESSLNRTLNELNALEIDDENLQGEKEPFLFLGSMSREQVEKLAAAMDAQKVSIDHKAVLTEHNGSWRLADLMKEVAQEAAYFKKRDELISLVENADIDRLKTDKRYLQAVMMGASVLKDMDAEPGLVEQMISMIERLQEK